MSKLLIRSIFTIILLMGLSACGGGGGGLAEDTTTDPDPDTDPDTDTGADTIKFGAYSGVTFSEGILSIGVSSLSAGGSTSVSAFLVDGNDIPLADGTVTQVTFTSTCASLGTASITSPITVASGRATATYQASGCIGTDTITARAATESGALSATGTITVAGASIGSVAFVSADPSIIALSGTGGAGRSETSIIKFKVINNVGGAVSGSDVEFTLDTTIGGLSLNPATATTDADGVAQTIVSSGSVPTAVRVTATVTSTSISTQSDKLTVSSGIADQNSFTISASSLNPEAWGYFEEPVTFSVGLADHFNNPVPDGTPVSFITEGGRIDGSCFTTDGSCSVVWKSQEPRPANGRVTVLATTVGEESFSDSNGNGKFDVGWNHDNNDSTPNILEPFTDLSEAWRDDDEDGCRDIANASTCTTEATTVIEEFLDFGGAADNTPNGIFDSPNSTLLNGAPEGDGIYNGVLCDDSSCIDAPKSLHVRASIVIVMSGSHPITTITDISSESLGGCIAVSDGAPSTVTFTITDDRLQQMPEGTTVAISSTIGETVLLDGFTTWPSSNSTAISTFEAEVKKDGDPDTGYFQITITTPKGSEITVSKCIIQT